MNTFEPQLNRRLIAAPSPIRRAMLRPAGKTESVYSKLPWLLRMYYPGALFGFGLISFLPGWFHVDSRPISMAFHALIVLVAIGILMTGRRGFRINPSFGFAVFLLFWALYSVRLLVDLGLRDVPTAQAPVLYWTFAYGVCFLPALAYFKTLPRIDYKSIAPVVWGTLGLICFLSLTFDLRNLSSMDREGRLAGNDIFNPIDLGHVGSSLAVISIGFLIQKQQYKKIPALWAAIAAGLGIVVLLLAGSRSALIGFVVIVLILLVSHFRGNRGYVIVIVVAGMVASAPWALRKLQSEGGSLSSRVQAVDSQSQIDSDVRMVLWRSAVHYISENPLTGVGLDIPGMGYPHEIVLEAFLATGLVGGTLLIVIIVHGIGLSWRLIREAKEPMWMGMLFVEYTILSLFSGTIYNNWGFWCTYALVVGSSYVDTRRRTSGAAVNLRG